MSECLSATTKDAEVITSTCYFRDEPNSATSVYELQELFIYLLVDKPLVTVSHTPVFKRNSSEVFTPALKHTTSDISYKNVTKTTTFSLIAIQ